MAAVVIGQNGVGYPRIVYVRSVLKISHRSVHNIAPIRTVNVLTILTRAMLVRWSSQAYPMEVNGL